ncbi:MAG: mechanosensitive ion channel family protein [Holophagaceae bacterium]|nr:mechanosensitive ion channel family protein [Holophagaceae bacterium]
MKQRPWIPAAVLLSLAALAAAGWFWTREPLPPAVQELAGPKTSGLRRQGPRRERLVDQTPLLTARSLLPLAQTGEEQQQARQAERLANHEVDLAFADALRRAALAPAQASPELKALADAKAKAESQVEADRQVVQRLTQQLAGAGLAAKGALQDQLEVAKAQLQLDTDEFDAAAEDLAKAGGDSQARIRRLKEAHEAADRESSRLLSVAPAPPAFQLSSLAGRIAEILALRAKGARLETARQEALAKAQALAKRHETLSQASKKDQEDREAAKYWATNLVQESPQGPGRDQAQQAVSYLKQYSDDQRRLADMGRRIQDQKALAEVYATWKSLVDGYSLTSLHHALSRLLWILGLALAAFLMGTLVDHLFHRAAGEKKSAGTLRVVVKLALQVLCSLASLFILFGLPAQTTTVLGLAGAGLTVALKDFIVAFFGWFILMGRNGIRVGDWVEIRGVGGEVVEIGLLRTVVLETGSWADAGHPTGRRVAFVNNFAIEGHFFNFSTSGKWMWDELTLLIPTGRDPYPLMDGIQKLVERETEVNARLAEQEWQGATARYRVKSFSAAPGLNILPSANGIEIRARYITRAFERHETRLRLNQAVVELMHGPRGDAGSPGGKGEA